MIRLPFLFYPFLILLFFLHTGCVKDIDLQAMDEIEFKPVAVVDLAEFTIEASLINNMDPGVLIPLEKEVPFEVVTEDLESNLSRLDLKFSSSNSLPRAFLVSVSFIAGRSEVMETVEFTIPPGDQQEHFEFTERFEGESLRRLNQSSKIKIKLEMQPGPESEEGKFSLRSTAAYRFRF